MSDGAPRRITPPETYLDLEERCFPGDIWQCGVYAIACLPTRMFYVGSTRRTFQQRWDEHIELLDARIHPNREMQADYDRFGQQEKAFWLCIIEITDEPLPTEREWIEYWTAKGHCYNRMQKRKKKPPP